MVSITQTIFENKIMFTFEAASAYECLQIMDYSLLDAKRFGNARHKCAPKP